MAVTVRRAVLDDAAEIAVVHAEARQAGYRDFVDEELLLKRFSGDLTARWQRQLGGDEPPVAFVAVRGDELVGYLELVMPSRDEDSGGVVAELTRMSVSPRAWRAGVGTALMEEALSALDSEGWAAVSFWVLEQNSQAVAFYSSFGFRADAAHTDPWSGQVEVRMRLPLTDADV